MGADPDAQRASGGRLEEALPEGIGHDRAAIVGGEEVFDADKALCRAIGEPQAQVHPQVGVVGKGIGRSVARWRRAVEVVGPVASDPFQLQIGEKTARVLVVQGGEKPVAGYAGDLVALELDEAVIEKETQRLAR